MVRFSPYMLGMEARRRSTDSPLESSKVVRPSCGSRRSAMLRLPMILRRLMMPACSSLGNSRISWSTPSMRQRTLSESSAGSRWMSDASMLAASVSSASTISMMSASISPPPAVILRLVACVLELAAGAEVDGDGLVEGRLGADDGHHALLGAHADLVDGDDVQRIGHGHHEAAVVVEAERHEPAADDEVARQQSEGPGLGRGLREVDHADVHLAGDRRGDVLLAHQSLGDEDLAEAPAAVVLAGEGAFQLLVRDQAAGDEQGAQLEAAVGALPAAADQRLELGPQLVRREGFGDVLGDARPVRVFEGREVAGRRERQHRRPAQLGVAGDQVQKLERVEAHEVEVEHDGRRWLLLQQAHGARVAEAGADVVAGPEASWRARRGAPYRRR